SILATCRHRARIRIGERNLLVLALHHLRVDRVEPDNLLLELLDLALQPDQLDIALALPLQASARRNPIEVAVDVKLEHNGRMIAGSAGIEWLDADESKLVEIKTIDEHVDRSYRVILDHVVIERRRKQCALPPIQSLNKALHQIPRESPGILSRESPTTER